MHSNTRQAVRVDAFGLREMVLGKSRQAHQRTIMHSNTRQAANNHALEHSTGSERVDAFGLREMVLGKSRQAHQRTAGSPANAKLTFRYPSSLINHSTLLLERSSAKLLDFYAGLTSEQSCTRTLDWQRTIMHSNTRQALNASTRSVYAKWYWVNHGRLTSERQAHQRIQSLPSATHRHSSITRPCCSSAQAPSFLSFTRWPLWRRAVEVIICMITRDFSVISIDVTGVSLSLSLLLTKVTHAQYRKRFRVSYNSRVGRWLVVDRFRGPLHVG